ncbi:MAG: sigma-70 family RNA polymerase sigma factor [Phycisphaeraceae bacterium]|nr:sigma-70 family RNA polymerase sigma factor [Phycisphaeraceae bacterium]
MATESKVGTNRTSPMDQQDNNPADYARRLLASQPRLRAYVRSMVFNPGDVDDLLQDVATIGWERFASYDRDRPFDAWLLGVARNRVLQYFEAQKKRPNALSPETLTQLEGVAFDASEQADGLQEALEACLGKLARPDYDLVSQRYESGATNRSVAKQLAVSESKISRSLNRIYAQLLLCIKIQDRGDIPGVRA